MFFLKRNKVKKNIIKKYNFGLVLKPKEVKEIRKRNFKIRQNSFYFEKKSLFIRSLIKRDVKILAKKKEIMELYKSINKNKKILVEGLFEKKNLYKIKVVVTIIEKKKKKPDFNLIY